MNNQGNLRLPPLRNLKPILPEPGNRSMESKAQLLARLETMQREIFGLESQADMGTAAEQRNISKRIGFLKGEVSALNSQLSAKEAEEVRPGRRRVA